jgi:7-carboxy-7-deazaguanine synthase
MDCRIPHPIGQRGSEMAYRVKEMVLTLQGEGANTGMTVVLCRFEGCNLSCDFCDTDFEGTDGPGGGVFQSPDDVAEAAAALWKGSSEAMNVLCTGGEPLLQLDRPMVKAFHRKGFSVLLETNGILKPPKGIDWICVSPKKGYPPVIEKGDELKLAFPQGDLDPALYAGMDFRHFYLQPIAGRNMHRNVRQAVLYCMAKPRWKLSLQLNKYIGLP